jgi:hypothetical protein
LSQVKPIPSERLERVIREDEFQFLVHFFLKLAKVLEGLPLGQRIPFWPKSWAWLRHFASYTVLAWMTVLFPVFWVSINWFGPLRLFVYWMVLGVSGLMSAKAYGWIVSTWQVNM